MPGRLPSAVIALYYAGEDRYVGVIAKQREAIPGLLVFGNVVHLTLYQCAGSRHSGAVPKVLTLEDARTIVWSRDGLESIILYKPRRSFVVEYVNSP